MATKKAKAKKNAKNDVIVVLFDGVLTMLEETLDGHTGKPEKLLKARAWTPSYGLRGEFTESVQTIFSGLDAAECWRLLSADFAPFVDGPALAMAVRHLMGSKARPFDVDLLNELLDQFAIRAVDDLARALLAMALGRYADIPATCAGLVTELRPRVAAVKAMLP